MGFSTEFKGHYNIDSSYEFGFKLRNRKTNKVVSNSQEDVDLSVTSDLSELENGCTTDATEPNANAMKEQQQEGPAESVNSPDGGNSATLSVSDGGSSSEDQQEKGENVEELNPWSRQYVGIPINYFSVGLIYAGSVSILYPVLVIQAGVTSSFFAAASSLVTVFWSYKVFFGMLCDCLPINGRKWRPYIVFGWILCAAMLIALGGMGQSVTPTNLVIMLTLSNLGYVMADVAADGFMVWMAHRESDAKRGRIQTLIYIIREIGRICINIVVLLGFSGPHVNCPGYEPDPSTPCTTDEATVARADQYLVDEYPDTWCHQTCPQADFSFGMTIPQYVWLIATVNIISLPSYIMLKEDKRKAEGVSKVMKGFWTTAKKRGVWQIMLYTMISSITFNVFIAAKSPANFVWLGLSNIQNQIRSIMESLIFTVGLSLLRRYALDLSWRKLIWFGAVMVSVFNLLYLLIVYDVIRNPWFYIFIDVSDTFMYTTNWLASLLCIVEVSEPGFEAMTYALITTANNATIPLSFVISFQLMAFFPDLNTQAGIEADTPSVRNQFALLILITEAVNLSSLACLPMLPRQKAETRELVKNGGSSAFWAGFALISASIFLLYSTFVTFFTVAGAETYGCLKIFGGSGCSENESSIPVTILLVACFLYSYGLNFYFTFLPILQGKEKFAWSMFF
mmetsp:Transcript_15892/g.39459  ORF Transcript_15892/g.39459 Transcript_15892/m.39459 type:complete len:680 (+) Transcript_15892:521-2560(+)